LLETFFILLEEYRGKCVFGGKRENKKILQIIRDCEYESSSASLITFLMRENDVLASAVHFPSLFFYSIYVINFTISTKLGINLLKKFIFSKNG
jgi:hypothetical protein